MFLDASAIVAIINDEPQAEALVAKIDAATSRFVSSPIVVWESVVALARISNSSKDDTAPLVRAFLKDLNAVQATITPEMGTTALEAFARYGKGSGHKAQLNMGDCFSYAVAKSYRVPILYIGLSLIHI